MQRSARLGTPSPPATETTATRAILGPWCSIRLLQLWRPGPGRMSAPLLWPLWSASFWSYQTMRRTFRIRTCWSDARTILVRQCDRSTHVTWISSSTPIICHLFFCRSWWHIQSRTWAVRTTAIDPCICATRRERQAGTAAILLDVALYKKGLQSRFLHSTGPHQWRGLWRSSHTAGRHRLRESNLARRLGNFSGSWGTRLCLSLGTSCLVAVSAKGVWFAFSTTRTHSGHIRPSFDPAAQLRVLSNSPTPGLCWWNLAMVRDISSWCVYRRSVRTNNDVEGWHHRINQRASRKPDLYQLIGMTRPSWCPCRYACCLMAMSSASSASRPVRCRPRSTASGTNTIVVVRAPCPYFLQSAMYIVHPISGCLHGHWHKLSSLHQCQCHNPAWYG